MTILITGAAGFIGTNLTKKFLFEGNNVIAIDNFYASDKKNIEQFLDNPRYTFINHDVRFTFPKFDKKIDWIFNLACPASPIHYQRDHIFTLDTCINGVKNIVDVAREHNSVLLHSSTSEVYGDPLEHPQKESYRRNVSTISTRSCYDEGKRVAESYLINYYRKENLKIKIIRIFNTYGPYMDKADGRVVSNFIIQALSNKGITLYGTGMQTRSFQYIDDLMNGMMKVMLTPDDFSGPVNLGNPVEFTIKELADEVLKLTNSKSELVFAELPDDDPKIRKPDISLAKKTLNWEPKIQLIEGLEKTIAFFKETL